MSVNAIGTGYQNQAKLPTPAIENERQNPQDASQVSKLNAEIKQAEAEMQETLKEVQKAVKESIGGSSEKVQILQSKLLMQQQEIMTKQMQIKKIESPKDSTTEQVSSVMDARPKFDRYVTEQEDFHVPDNMYHLEVKDGMRQIIFNRPEEENALPLGK